MQERQATVDGETMLLPEPFLVMATQNPVEMEGTFPLPEAQLDRFMLRIKLGYPTADEEVGIYTRFEKDTVLPGLEAVTSAEELATLQEVPPTVKVDEPVRSYIVSIVGATREHEGITLGASPRAGMALYKATQVWAAMQDRGVHDARRRQDAGAFGPFPPHDPQHRGQPQRHHGRADRTGASVDGSRPNRKDRRARAPGRVGAEPFPNPAKRLTLLWTLRLPFARPDTCSYRESAEGRPLCVGPRL